MNGYISLMELNVNDKKKERCMIIDVAVPSKSKTFVKVTEKLTKYKDLHIEVGRMLGMKAETIPVFVGALGLMKKRNGEIYRIPGNIDL